VNQVSAIAGRTHRNGFGCEGNKNEFYTPAYIKYTAEIIKRLVNGIENALSLF